MIDKPASVYGDAIGESQEVGPGGESTVSISSLDGDSSVVYDYFAAINI